MRSASSSTNGSAIADGTFKSAFYNFEKTAQFEELLEVHLRDWIRERLKAAEVVDSTQGQWKGSPFRGLQAFDFEHALIYCGRTGLVSELLDVLRRRGASGHGFLMVTGMSGVGKSSLVKAGLLPILMRPRVVEHVIAWRRADVQAERRRPYPARHGFAAALLEPHALPEIGRGRAAHGSAATRSARTDDGSHARARAHHGTAGRASIRSLIPRAWRSSSWSATSSRRFSTRPSPPPSAPSSARRCAP